MLALQKRFLTRWGALSLHSAERRRFFLATASMNRSNTILVLILTAAVAAMVVPQVWPQRCPEWALKDVHGLYIDLADGKMQPGTIEYFGGKIEKAVNEIHDEECQHAYTAFASDTVTKSNPELRALAASFLARWGGSKYQPVQ